MRRKQLWDVSFVSKLFLFSSVAVTVVFAGGGVAAFQIMRAPITTSSTTTTTTILCSKGTTITTTTTTATTATRRDILSSFIPSAIIILSTPTSKTNAATIEQKVQNNNSNYQGVYSDPNHPKAYRILFGDDKKATIKLQDDPKSLSYELPIKVNSNNNQLTFDFSAKGGPTNIVGILGTTTTEEKEKLDTTSTTTISFPDSGPNTKSNTWTKITDGIAGVYKVDLGNINNDIEYDFVSIRKWPDKAEWKVEMMKGSETIASFGAKGGSKKVFFEYPNEFQKAGFIDPIENTITFRDGIIWTRF